MLLNGGASEVHSGPTDINRKLINMNNKGLDNIDMMNHDNYTE